MRHRPRYRGYEPESHTDSRLGVIESQLTTYGTRISTQEAKTDGMVQTMANASKPNWANFIAVAMLGAVLVGGAWQLVELKTQVALAPLQAQAAISTEERQSLAKRADENRSLILEHAVSLGRVFEKTREIEQQFKRVGEGLNHFTAEQNRTNKILWDATGKMGEYPAGPYFFPNYSQHLPNQ